MSKENRRCPAVARATRRDLLKLSIAGAVLVPATAVEAVAAQAEGAPEKETWTETEHIRTYYQRARF